MQIRDGGDGGNQTDKQRDVECVGGNLGERLRATRRDTKLMCGGEKASESTERSSSV